MKNWVAVKRHFINKNAGFSMIQVLMTMGLMSILAINLTYLAKSQSQISKKGFVDQDLLDLDKQIRLVLSDSVACNNTFPNSSMGTIAPEIVGKNGAAAYSANQVIGHIRFDSFELQQANPSIPLVAGELESFIVRTKVTINGKDNLGGSVKEIQTPIYGKVDGSGELTECSADLKEAIGASCEPHGVFSPSLAKCVPKTNSVASPLPCLPADEGVMAFNTDLNEMEVCTDIGWVSINNPYTPGQWYTVKNTVYSEPLAATDYLSDVQNETFTLPFNACGFRMNYRIEDSGFIGVYRQDNSIIFTRSNHMAHNCGGAASSPCPIDQNQTGCPTTKAPGFYSGVFEFCVRPWTDDAVTSDVTDLNLMGNKGETFKVHSFHAANHNGAYHRYNIEAKVCTTP